MPKKIRKIKKETILNAEDDLMLWLEFWGEREEDEKVYDEEDC
jgi:hypothetical protein